MSLPDYLAVGEQARLIPVTDSNKEARAASILLSRHITP